MSQRNLAWLLIVPGFVALLAVISFSAPAPDQDYLLVQDVVEVLAEVDKNYVRELNDEQKKQLVKNMINGGLSKLDPYCEYYSREDLELFNTTTEGEFGGIGAYLSEESKSGFIMIESPMFGTPAFEAGLLPGDLIVQVEGQSTANVGLDPIRSKIKGEPGTTVTLTIRRVGAKADFPVTLTRSVIEIHPVQGYQRQADNLTEWEYMVDPAAKIAMIRLSAFNDKTEKEMIDAVKTIEAQGAQGLILDLRDNPGGLLNQAVAVSNLFLKEGMIVSTKDRNNNGRSWSAKEDGTLFEPAKQKPIAVLVNEASASASEILAAALQDNGRAVIVGQRTYGKGSVQKVYELSGRQSGMKLTTEVWLTPQGRNINRWPDSKDTDDWGVIPNDGLAVELKLEQLQQYYLHKQLLIALPRKQVGPPDANRPQLDPNYQDSVVEKALEYLRGRIKTITRAKLAPGLPA